MLAPMTTGFTNRAAANRKPTSFFWQGLLILLPVGILSIIGFVSLQQDRRLAELEATERAQSLADDLAGQLWDDLVSEKAVEFRGWFEIRPDGSLLTPPAVALLTPVQFDLNILSEEQAKFWRTARSYELAQGNDAGAIEAYLHFIRLAPPTNFLALAHFSLGLLRSKTGETSRAVDSFAVVARQFTMSTGETGLPLAPLAALKAMESFASETNAAIFSQFPDAPLMLEKHAFYQPNAMTGAVLERALELERRLGPASPYPRIGEVHSSTLRGEKIEHFSGTIDFIFARWMEHERMRALHKAAHPCLRAKAGTNVGTLPAFWFQAPAFSQNDSNANSGEKAVSDWMGLMTSSDSSDHRSVRCAAAKDVEQGIAERINQRVRLPDYFGASVAVAGRSVLSSNELIMLVAGTAGKPSSPAWIPYPGSSSPILATARKSESGVECLRVNVHLTSPQMIFANQRARGRTFGWLIGASALAALIGFVSSRRAFLKQERLTEMKSDFVSSVSHELRAPIASVRLMAEGLECGKINEPDKQRDYFRFIVQECRRLSSMIENVLDFARIEQGRKRFDFEPCDLAALVEATVRGMEPYAAERNVTLKLELPSQDESQRWPSLAVDARAIQQALVNLIDNAIKHSPGGSVVTVSLHSSSAAGADHPLPVTHSPAVILSVTDHGPGIPQEEHEKIFERFYRRGSELRRETTGVGIGLSIVKHIVEAHSGRVRVVSAAGQGSQFVIELPLAEGQSSKLK